MRERPAVAKGLLGLQAVVHSGCEKDTGSCEDLTDNKPNTDSRKVQVLTSMIETGLEERALTSDRGGQVREGIPTRVSQNTQRGFAEEQRRAKRVKGR